MIAALFGVVAGFGSLFVYTFAVFVKPLGAAFGWNREVVSLGFGIAAMTVGVRLPLLGRLIGRDYQKPLQAIAAKQSNTHG